MGNLGSYQALTTTAKKVGGPKALVALMLIAGYAALRPAEAGIRRAVQAVTTPDSTSGAKDQIFRATSDGQAASGLAIREGDEYRVLEQDGDAVLIEVIGRGGNPYVVPSTFLASISDFAC